MKHFFFILFFWVFFLSAEDSIEILCPDQKFVPSNGRILPEKKGLLFDPAQKSYLWLHPAETDWSSWNVISCRIWSPRKIKGELMLRLNSNPKGKSGQCYSKKFMVFHQGWKTYSFPLSSFAAVRNPVGFQQIEQVVFLAGGWGMKQGKDFQIVLDSIRLTKTEPPREKKELPPVTSSLCWPPDVPEAIKAETVKDPDFMRKCHDIESMRNRFATRRHAVVTQKQKELISNCFELIAGNGSFRDLAIPGRSDETVCNLAYERLKVLLSAWNGGGIPKTPENKQKLSDALIYYLDFDYNRTSDRWISSSFHLPQIAVETYFTFREEMNAVEEQRTQDSRAVHLNRLCKAVAMQAFSEPLRNDVEHPLLLEQFRNHPHWIGGNFGYRPLVGCALVCRNPAMLDRIAEICDRALSVTSWNTRRDSFWSEGMTADGGGWGHGTQCYLFGYPLDGLRAILNTGSLLKNTRWERKLSTQQQNLIVDYLETLLWFSYAPDRFGPTLMAPARAGMLHRRGRGFQSFPYDLFALAEAHLPPEAVNAGKRLDAYEKTASGKAPEFTGVRYWWNQDAMIARGKDFFLGIKMVSARTASNEVVTGASRKTEFLSDGATFLMKRPDTYCMAKGYWNFTAVPGTTLRQGDYQIHSDTWSGYRGLHSFAGGVADGKAGAAGFIYQKAPLPNILEPLFYQVIARKSYFVAGSVLICCGSGITDLDQGQGKNLWTTVDQTEWRENLEYEQAGKIIAVKPHDPVLHTQDSGLFLMSHAFIGYGIDLKHTTGSAVLSAGTRKSRWKEADKRNTGNKDLPAQYPVLQLHIDHGKNVRNASYVYFVHMNSPNLEFLKDFSAGQNYEILSLTDSVHAVKLKDEQTTSAVFFEKNASFSDGVRQWRSNDKAIVLIRKISDGTVRISVADPEQKAEKKILRLSCNPALNGKEELEFILPDGVNCGKAVSRTYPQ